MPSDTNASELALSLKSLEALDFGPKWGSSASQPSSPSMERRESPRPSFRNFPDKRPPFKAKKTLERQTKLGREMPEFSIQFFPEDVPFKALSKAIRHSHKTYELFELARLVLEKPERFSISVKKIDNLPPASKMPIGSFASQGTAFPLYLSVLDGLIFESQDEVLNHILSHHASHFFHIEEQEVEGPKGQFPFIHCCGITGKPISPPNYHRYSELLQAHYKENIQGLSFERFLKGLKADKAPETQAAWLEKMKKQRCYRPLSVAGEAPLLTSSQEAKHYLLTHCKNTAWKEQSSLSFQGISLEKLSPYLRNAIQEALAQQRDFPLAMSNHIRSRLRHYGFCVYKRGAKGITYVCSVKRKRREATTQFSESIQRLIEFLEAHPLWKLEKVLEQFLGLAPEQDLQAAAKENPLVPSVLRELEWLVAEGYVIQYSDTRLEAVGPLGKVDVQDSSPSTVEQPAKEALS